MLVVKEIGRKVVNIVVIDKFLYLKFQHGIKQSFDKRLIQVDESFDESHPHISHLVKPLKFLFILSHLATR